MSPMQIRTVAICMGINLIDGFDVLAISFVASHIGTAWGLSATELGLIFSAGVLGMLVGSLLLATVADRIGRRPAILLFLSAVSIAMAGCAMSADPGQLMFWRFMTGAGVGGLLPSLNTLVAEFASRKRQELSVSFMQSGFPLGATIGGFAALLLIEQFGWTSVFWAGAVLSALMIPVAGLWLPESPAFLLHRRPANALERLNALYVRMGRAPLDNFDIVNITIVDRKPGKIGAFSTISTLPLPIIMSMSISFFCTMACFYFVTSWTPKLLVNAGLATTSGISGGILLNVFGVIGGLLVSWCFQGRALRTAVLGYMLCGAVSLVAFGLITGEPSDGSTLLWTALLSAGIVGFFMNGTMIGLYAMTPALLPPASRATGTGIAIGFGRFGALAGPMVTGVLLDSEMPIEWIFGAFALPMLVAAGSLGLMQRITAATDSGRNPERIVERKEKQ